MRLLLDTHAFLFAIGEPSLLSVSAREALADENNPRWVSARQLQGTALAAQARIEGLTPLTRDEALRRNPVEVLW